jgi:hypothetical protein
MYMLPKKHQEATWACSDHTGKFRRTFASSFRGGPANPQSDRRNISTMIQSIACGTIYCCFLSKIGVFGVFEG